MEKDLGTYVDPNTEEHYTVIERTREVKMRNRDGTNHVRQGAVDYVTSSGKDLNRIGDDLDAFEIVQTGIVIRKGE